MDRVEISMFMWAKSFPRTWELDWAFEVHGLGWVGNMRVPYVEVRTWDMEVSSILLSYDSRGSFLASQDST